MEYPQQVWLSFWLAFLPTYVRSAWLNSFWVSSETLDKGQGFIIEEGTYSWREENKKPYDSGDPRAG